MWTQIKLGFGALSVAVVLVGCGAGQQVQNGDLTAAQDADSAKEDSARKQSHPELYACDTDADCVAVEKAGCCPNGFLVAVNKGEVDAYDAKYACKDTGTICPQFVVHDTRVAQCDFSTHSCQMIAPEEITCGGFIAPARQHHCPDGYQCNLLARGVPDAGGKCEPAPATN